MWRRAVRIINRPRVMGQMRHLTTVIGTILAMNGVVGEQQWQVWSGLVLAILAFVGSAMAEEKR